MCLGKDSVRSRKRAGRLAWGYGSGLGCEGLIGAPNGIRGGGNTGVRISVRYLAS